MKAHIGVDADSGLVHAVGFKSNPKVSLGLFCDARVGANSRSSEDPSGPKSAIHHPHIHKVL
jgi:hypothetical protein